jgi:hypothetical protein
MVRRIETNRINRGMNFGLGWKVIRGPWQRGRIAYCACCTAELFGAGRVTADEDAEDKVITPLMTTLRFVNLHLFCGLLLKRRFIQEGT